MRWRSLVWSPAELLERGAGFQSFTPDSAQLAHATLGRAMAEGASHARYECEHLRKDGSTIWCEVDVSLLRDAEGRVTGMLGVTRESSARRRAEADRERIQAELAHAQRMEIVGRIAASVAHDLNNQLAVILGTVEALSDESSTTRADAQKDVAAAAESAAALTRQLQIFSQGRATRRVPFDLNVLVRRLDRTLRRVVGTGIDLVVAAGASPAVVLADGAQIEQVILNLVMNARDAMPCGGRLSLEVAAGEGQRAALWLVRVGDTSSGIDEATRARLFEPFFTTKPEGSGTGLGLAMVQRIAEETGGSVSVQSELGCGTTFEVALPRYTGPIESEKELASDSDTQRAATILVVDDSVEILHLFGNVLFHHGYHVLEANSPAQALALAAQPIDLVVSDVVMPGTRGPELIRMLRKDRPEGSCPCCMCRVRHRRVRHLR